MNKSNLLVLLALFVSFAIHAQQNKNKAFANIKGKVIDNQNFPLPGATAFVNIDGKIHGATTDFDGKFLLTRVPAGSYTLEITYIGYASHFEEVSLSANQTLALPSVTLSERSEKLKGVTVTGQSRGKLKALNVEHNADNILNVISLEQAEKIPDDNVGDVLKRIAGINVGMDQGEARTVNIRGLGPEAANILIDGELVSSTAYGGSRAVELDLIPANVIQNIEVSKSVSADMDGEANGATVNLITRVALNQKTQLTGSAYSSFVTTDDDPGYNIDLNVARRFYNNKLGLSFNASSNRRNYKSDNIEADWDFADAGDPDTPFDDARFLNEFEIRQYWLSRVRHSMNLSTDYIFNDHHSIGFKLSSSFRNEFENRYRTSMASLDFPQSFNPDNTYTTEGDLRIETIGGPNEGRPNGYQLDRKETIYGNFYGEHLIKTTEVDWNMSFSSSYKNRNRREIEYEATEGDFDVTIDVRNPSKPRFEILNLTNLYNATLFSLSTWGQFIDGSRTSLRLDVEHPTSFGYIKTGGRYRINKRFEENKFFNYRPTTDVLSHFGKVPSIHYTREKFYPGSYTLFPAVSRSFLGGLDLEGTSFTKTESIGTRFRTSYDADERVLATYGLAKIEFSNAFYIRLGVRLEQTNSEYSSLSFNEVTGQTKDNTNRERYLNTLPSASFKYKINEDLTLRGGFSKTISRPRHSQISPSIRFEGTNSDGLNKLYQGNPDLKPSSSLNYDLSLKYRLGQASSISVDGFTKRLDNRIDNVEDVMSIGNGEQLEITTPKNVGVGHIKGIEFSFNLNMVDIIQQLRNFSLYSNVTFVDSYLKGFPDINNFRAGEKRRLAFTSDTSYNVSLLYNADRWEFSSSLNSTSPYLRTYRDIPQDDRYYDKQQFVDINISYKVRNGIYMFLQGKNLTNQSLRYYTGSKHYLEQEEFYGPNFVVGLRYKLQ